MKTSLSKFQRIFHLPKMAAISNFFAKIVKHKNACISKTVRDRVISTKFFTPGYEKTTPFQVSTDTSLAKNGGHFEFSNLFLLYPIFQKINYPSQKWELLSIFKFVTKSAKHQIASVSLTMQDRAMSSKFLKHTVSKITTLPKNHFSYILALLSRAISRTFLHN